jgi:hypothetical protein
MSGENIFLMIIYSVVVLMAGFTLLNMLVGVVNQVVSNVSNNENLTKKAHEISENMRATYEAERQKEDGPYVTRALFQKMLTHAEFRKALKITGIVEEHYHTIECCLFLQEDLTERKLDFEEEFITDVAELSPERIASVMHGCDLRLRCRTTIYDYKAAMEESANTIVTTQGRVLEELDKFNESQLRKKAKKLKKVRAAVLMGMGANEFLHAKEKREKGDILWPDLE